MPSSSKRKGDRAELEVQALWREHTGYGRRALGAGRLDDVGDIHGLPLTVCQVSNKGRINEAVNEKPMEAERQRITANVPFACTFVRQRGGKYRVVMTPEQFFTMWREAING